MANGVPENECVGLDCGFGETGGNLGCTSGGSCFAAKMLVAKKSKFHDQALFAATQKIRAALDEIQPDADGRQLSFIHTKFGTMLAWVSHDIEVPEGAVRANSPDEAVKAALGLVL